MTSPSLSVQRVALSDTLGRVLSTRLTLRWEVALYAGLFLAAVTLRLWDLGANALHHDESIHAQWSWDLLRGNYKHSPVFHGPFYYHFQGVVFFLFGANDFTSRLSAAISGMIIVALPLLLRRRLGPVGTLAACTFLAFSPTAVYYSRFFREDIYMAMFVLLMVGALWRYIADGRERWLFVFTVAFVGGVTTKEGMFLTIAVFLLYLDIYVAAQLSGMTADAVAARRAERELPPRDDRLDRALLTVGLIPLAVPIVALWPFLGSFAQRQGWTRMPRSGDLLVLLGTLTLPLLTPMLRWTVMEPLGFVDRNVMGENNKLTSRLDWDDHLRNPGSISGDDRLILGGLFLLTTSAAAFVGLQWRPRTWAICFAGAVAVYCTLMTSLWTNLDGLVSGPWGSLDYWREEQVDKISGYRGDQPWYYYYLLMPAYEFLPLIIAAMGAFWAVFKGDAFSRFLVFWLAGQWLALSYGSEKMPWLNTHLAVPACILAAWTVGRAANGLVGSAGARALAVKLGWIGVLGLTTLALVVALPGGLPYHAARAALAVAAICASYVILGGEARRLAAAAVVMFAIGALAPFSVRTMGQAVYARGDIPKDMLIYTQSSPDIPRIMDQIERLAEVSGKGRFLPILVDDADSFAWPWAWYLRDWKCVGYLNLSTASNPGTSNCQGEEQPYAVVLANSSNLARVEDWSSTSLPGYYGVPARYPHRWWFDETYKSAMRVNGAPECTGRTGDCGPRRLETWKFVADNVFSGSWLRTWYLYWRDHDPDAISGSQGPRSCNSCGSVDAYVFFPATFDPKTGQLTPGTVTVLKPTTDGAGRPSFGGPGTQPGGFFSPVDIEVDAEGNLYVVDSRRRKVQKFDAAGNLVGVVDVRVDPANTNEASEPWGLAVGPDGRIVVADTFGWRIRVFDASLNSVQTYGQPYDAQAAATPGPYDLFGPRDVAIDSSGQAWVTDTGNGRILVYDPAGAYVREIGTKGAGRGKFNEPVGIAIAPDGTVFVADMYNGRVVMLTPQGDVRGEFPVDGWGGRGVDDKPYIKPLRDGRVAVSLPLQGRVLIYTRDGQLSGVIDPRDEPLSRPYGMVETSDGKLWIVEGGASRVRQFPLP
jgi:predicted membrane-bound mannosyltransferase/DNA-binding beta-propeller fold protein YncE